MSFSKEDVAAIVEAVGGKENISAVSHCVTRLRFALKEEDQVDEEKLKKNQVVKGFFSANGQFQVVIGQGTVEKVYRELIQQTGLGEATKQEIKDEAAKKGNALQRGIKVLADIFIPILPAIVTAGLLLGINNILTGSGIFYEDRSFVEVHPEWAGIAGMISLIASAAFVFLPALVGWSAVKRFGGSPLLGIVLGLVMVHPGLLSAYSYADARAAGEIPMWNLFGLEVQKIGYQGQVLPVLVASYVLAQMEKFLKKRIPDAFQLLLVAPTALLVTGFLTFLFIGPVTFAIGNWLVNGIVAIFQAFPALGGLIYGAIYAPLVITGMHHTFFRTSLAAAAEPLTFANLVYTCRKTQRHFNLYIHVCQPNRLSKNFLAENCPRPPRATLFQ